jgi:hypothetical protein
MKTLCNHDQSSPLSLHAKRASKRVRIALPPSPPPDSGVEMETESVDMMQHTQQQLRRSQRISENSGHVVLPTDAVKESERLRSGSKWRQHDLALLRVKFEPYEGSEFSVLDVEYQWSPSQRQSRFLLLFTRRIFL